MRQIWVVFAYTLKDAARKKAFKISTVILLLVVLAACLVINLTSDKPGSEGETSQSSQALVSEAEETGSEGSVFYIDAQNAIPGGMEALQEAMPGYAFSRGTETDAEMYRLQIAEDPQLSLVWVTGNNGSPAVSIWNKDFMSGISSGEVGEILTRQYIVNQLEKQGVQGDVSAVLSLEIPVYTEIAGEMDLSGYILGIVILMLMFFAIYYYGYGVSMSIATEKTSRVMETLVVSAKPSRILLGKCLAMGVLGLLQFGGTLAFAALCCHFLIPDGLLIMGMPLSLSSFTLSRALIILAYFILGYALYAVMNAVCGASVSKIEDINSAMMPVMLISLVSFYLGYFSAVTASGTESVLQKAAIYIPFCSPFIVPFKILNGDVPAMDIALSLGALVLAIILIAAVSIRIYTASVLHYGSRLKLKDMFKLKA